LNFASGLSPFAAQRRGTVGLANLFNFYFGILIYCRGDFKQSRKLAMNNGNSTIGTETIVLGGGCFWCTEAVFTRVRGVTAVESGYCNGHVLNPSYEQICEGNTGHAEVIKVSFNTDEISLATLLQIFFTTHDPTTLNRQGNDVGTQYRSGIYFQNEEQQRAAQVALNAIEQAKIWGAPLVTEIKALDNYSTAEAYHQRYFELHPQQSYCAYVVAPKVAKLRKQFTHLLKSGS
jgi:peptide-methionine (S)-S-oxide reductase